MLQSCLVQCQRINRTLNGRLTADVSGQVHNPRAVLHGMDVNIMIFA